MPRKPPRESKSTDASALIDRRIAELGDWRGRTLGRLRDIIRKADPEIVEEWKWNVPVWSRGGIICTGETYRSAVKLTFARGASVADPSGLFTSSLEGKVRRAVDVHEGDRIDAKALTALVRAAVAVNLAGGREKVTARGRKATPDRNGARKRKAAPKSAPAKPVRLLSGGNPQIAKADGDEPVQAYIAAMPDWKRDVGRRLDDLITRTVPGVRKAVRWNSPFYGVEGRGWFASFHVFTRFVKVTFFNGLALRPIPPGGTPKSGEARWIDLHEGDPVDDARMAKWIRQAARLPGWTP
jgi:hypothetical protein